MFLHDPSPLRSSRHPPSSVALSFQSLRPHWDAFGCAVQEQQTHASCLGPLICLMLSAFDCVVLFQRLLIVNTVIHTDLDYRRFPCSALCPVNAIDVDVNKSLGIRSRAIPGQYTTGLAKATNCRLGAPLIQDGSFVERFRHVKREICLWNHEMNITTHETVRAIAIQSLDFSRVALESTSYSATMTARYELILAFWKNRYHCPATAMSTFNMRIDDAGSLPLKTRTLKMRVFASRGF
jgi:hypothetical protein